MKRQNKYCKFIIMLSACLAMLPLPACTDEPGSDTTIPMAISASFGVSSRATTTQVPLDGNKYAMWACAVYKSDETSSAFYSPNFYFNPNPLQLDYNTQTNNYVATNYFYPLGGNMQIVAYATNEASAPSASFTYGSNNSLSHLNVDLSASDGKREVVYSDIASIGCPITDNPALQFHRAQTNLRFKFIPADESTCSHVIINSIEIKDVQWRGKFIVTYNSLGKASHQWISSVSKANYKFSIVAENTIPPADSDLRMKWVNDQAVSLEIGDGLHMLPKTDGRTQIIIRYTVLNNPTSISSGGVGGSVPESLLGRPEDYIRHLTYVIDADLTKNWEDATQYYYNITVHGNAQMNVENVSVATINLGTTGTMEI